MPTWHGPCKVSGIAGEGFAGLAGRPTMPNLSSVRHSVLSVVGAFAVSAFFIVAAVGPGAVLVA